MRLSGVWGIIGGVALICGAPQANAQAPRPAAPLTAPAKPADPAKSDRERDIAKATEPMKFQRVRSASPTCGDACPEWISAEGRIMSGITAFQLKRQIMALGDRKLPIFIHSAGGSVEEAYAMGRLIRARGLAVSVTKTDMMECALEDKTCRALGARGIKYGNPKPPLSVCASSCVFVLAAGAQRHVGPASLVGVHQYESSVTQVQVLQRYRLVTDQRTGELKKEVISEQRVGSKTVKTRTKSEVYDKSATYFAEMGVAKAIMEPLLATPNSSMHWLSPSEITATKIATDRKSGPQVLAAVEAPQRDTTPSRAERRDQTLDPARTEIQTPPAVTASAASVAKAAPPLTYAPMIARTIQQWLKTSNCFSGTPGDLWGISSTRALARLGELTKTSFSDTTPTMELLEAVRKSVMRASSTGSGPVTSKICDAPVD
jgi:hypothetical protein